MDRGPYRELRARLAGGTVTPGDRFSNCLRAPPRPARGFRLRGERTALALLTRRRPGRSHPVLGVANGLVQRRGWRVSLGHAELCARRGASDRVPRRGTGPGALSSRPCAARLSRPRALAGSHMRPGVRRSADGTDRRQSGRSPDRPALCPHERMRDRRLAPCGGASCSCRARSRSRLELEPRAAVAWAGGHEAAAPGRHSR